MLVKIKGLVVRDTVVNDTIRYISLLTEEHGKISVFIKNTAKYRRLWGLPTKVFSYSEFVLYESQGKYRFNEASLIESFFGLGQSFDALALASYIVSCAEYVTEEEQPDAGIFSLTLNTLWAITHLKDRDHRLIKGAFEMRLAGLCGFAPNVFYCAGCGSPPDGKTIFFDIMGGCVRCAACERKHEEGTYFENNIRIDPMRTAQIILPLSEPTAAAIRYVLTCEPNMVFSFALAESCIPEFRNTCERYLENHLEHHFEALDMLDM